MTSNDEETCIAKYCNQPADGRSVSFGFPLCKEHQNDDVQRCEKRKPDFLRRLDELVFKNATEKQDFQLEQQALIAEINQLVDVFDAVQEKLQHWREHLMSCLQDIHPSVSDRLSNAAEAEICIKEISTMPESASVRDLLELTVSMESWLDKANERTEKLSQRRAEVRERQNSEIGLRSFGDVSSGVQHLQVLMDKHLNALMKACWLNDEKCQSASNSWLKVYSEIKNLPNRPTHVAICTNTAGFVGDAAGQVVRAESAIEGSVSIPEPCIFVAFENQSSDNLLVVSIDGAVKLRCHSEEVSRQEDIFGFEIDSNRQLLFIARKDAVIVTDLSGAVVKSMDSKSVGQPLSRIRGMICNRDKLFLLSRIKNRESILLVDKATYAIQSAFSLSGNFLKAEKIGMVLCGESIILSDAELTSSGRCDAQISSVYKLCAASGKIIASCTVSPKRVDETRGLSKCCVSVTSDGVVLICGSSDTLKALPFYNLSDKDISENPVRSRYVCDSFADLALLEENRKKLLVSANYKDQKLVISNVFSERFYCKNSATY